MSDVFKARSSIYAPDISGTTATISYLRQPTDLETINGNLTIGAYTDLVNQNNTYYIYSNGDASFSSLTSPYYYGNVNFNSDVTLESTNNTAPSQTASSASSLMTRQLVDSLLTDTSIIYYRDDFVGVADSTQIFGELGWSYGTVNGAGNIRPYNISSAQFGVVGLNPFTGNFRSAVITTWDVSNLIGGGGFQFQANGLENSTTVYKTRFQLSSLEGSIGLGFSNYNLTTYKTNNFFGLRYAKPSNAWTSNTPITANQYRRPTTPNGRRYYASANGTTAATEPTWQTGAGSSTIDGSVTWIENGLDGNANFILQNCPASANELLSTTGNSNIVANANVWYNLQMSYSGSNTWNFSLNGTGIGSLLMSSNIRTSNLLPVYKVESSQTGSSPQLSVDYFMLFSRGVTR